MSTPEVADKRSEPYSPGESRLYNNDPRSKRLSSGSSRGTFRSRVIPCTRSSILSLFYTIIHSFFHLRLTTSIDDGKELIKGLMEGAAEPGQTQTQDKQGKKMKEIQAEVDLARVAMEDTVMKIQERGQKLDHLQDQTGESILSLLLDSSWFPSVERLRVDGKSG